MTVLHRITGVLVFRYMGSQLWNFGNCSWKPVPPSRDVMCTHSIKTQWFIHILICLLISAFIIYAVYTIVVCKEHCWVLMTIHSLDEEVYKMMRERDDSNPDLLFTISVEGCCFQLWSAAFVVFELRSSKNEGCDFSYKPKGWISPALIFITFCTCSCCCYSKSLPLWSVMLEVIFSSFWDFKACCCLHSWFRGWWSLRQWTELFRNRPSVMNCWKGRYAQSTAIMGG